MKTSLILLLALLMVFGAVAPVMAMGPYNAVDSNPNLELQDTICDMEMGMGTESSNRWQNNVGTTNAYLGRDFTQYRAAVKEDVEDGVKGASVVLTYWGPAVNSPVGWGGYTRAFYGLLIFGDAGIPGATFAAEYENTWIYMSSDYMYLWFQRAGSSQSEAYQLAYVQWQYGVYFRYVDIR